ncbi:keratin, type I cuticular Ha3-II-like [Hyla sarda]|uniref:keratin, type I cuticular Ha3-II-like n=1 Tax=Hyla sarda TaxID=327740 RepID=UPI0024C3FD67|nr:keratin, type I cuticular Ha3-II-like [Hyla sarda]
MVESKTHSSFFAGYQRKMYPVGTYLPSYSCYSNHGGYQRPSHGGLIKSHGRPHSSIPGGPHMSHYGDSHVNHKVAAYIFHHGRLNTLHHVGPYDLTKGYGDPKTNRVSQGHREDIHSHKKTSGGHGFLNNHTTLNEKGAMRLLNDRLSSYLGEICSLEQENERLKKMISEWQRNNSPIITTDQSQYSSDIRELQNKISSKITGNAAIVLQINNARTAFDDFNKNLDCKKLSANAEHPHFSGPYSNRWYEMEHNVRHNIEADVKTLHRIGEECKDETGKLESEVEILEQELLKMKKKSEQEINSLTIQLGPRVSVEVEAAKSKHLTKALSDIREQYENIIENNQREAESLFFHTVKKLNPQVATSSMGHKSVQSTIIRLKSSVQIMEVNLQYEQNMITVLQGILAEKKDHYSAEVMQRQNSINTVEDQLQRIRPYLRDLYETNTFFSKHNMRPEIITYQQLMDE